jgi:hypothetical protein
MLFGTSKWVNICLILIIGGCCYRFTWSTMIVLKRRDGCSTCPLFCHQKMRPVISTHSLGLLFLSQLVWLVIGDCTITIKATKFLILIVGFGCVAWCLKCQELYVSILKSCVVCREQLLALPILHLWHLLRPEFGFEGCASIYHLHTAWSPLKSYLLWHPEKLNPSLTTK